MYKKQNGFAHVAILLVAVILAAIGFSGWWVWHNNHKKTTNSPVVTVKSFDGCKKAAGSKLLETFPEQCVTKDGVTFTGPSAQTTQQYFTIKEWGVKFKTNEDNKDAYYVFYENTKQYLYLDSTDLDSLKAYDGSSCKGEYIAILGQYKKDDPALNDPATLGPVGEQKTVGDYVYTFSTKKQYAAACLFDQNQNPIDANTAVYDKKVSAYTAMFDAIQAD